MIMQHQCSFMDLLILFPPRVLEHQDLFKKANEMVFSFLVWHSAAERVRRPDTATCKDVEKKMIHKTSRVKIYLCQSDGYDNIWRNNGFAGVEKACVSCRKNYRRILSATYREMQQDNNIKHTDDSTSFITRRFTRFTNNQSHSECCNCGEILCCVEYGHISTSSKHFM